MGAKAFGALPAADKALNTALSSVATWAECKPVLADAIEISRSNAKSRSEPSSSPPNPTASDAPNLRDDNGSFTSTSVEPAGSACRECGGGGDCAPDGPDRRARPDCEDGMYAGGRLASSASSAAAKSLSSSRNRAPSLLG